MKTVELATFALCSLSSSGNGDAGSDPTGDRMGRLVEDIHMDASGGTVVAFAIEDEEEEEDDDDEHDAVLLWLLSWRVDDERFAISGFLDIRKDLSLPFWGDASAGGDDGDIDGESLMRFKEEGEGGEKENDKGNKNVLFPRFFRVFPFSLSYFFQGNSVIARPVCFRKKTVPLFICLIEFKKKLLSSSHFNFSFALINSLFIYAYSYK